MESMQVPWCPGLRLKMEIETEDLSRISWFMGTIAGVEAADPARWPQLPWSSLPRRSSSSVIRGGYFSNFIGDLGRV
jgi:hypothetical protein